MVTNLLCRHLHLVLNQEDFNLCLALLIQDCIKRQNTKGYRSHHNLENVKLPC